MLNFYPSNTYIEKKYAPEKIDDKDLQALAKAESLAVKNKVMSKEVSEYFLANALVEGRPGNYGVNDQINMNTRTDKLTKAADSLGISPQKVWEPIAGVDPGGYRYSPEFPVDGSIDKATKNALLAAAILSSKGNTAQEAITKWNGSGAGAENHWKKVQQAKDMLDRPENKELIQRYRSYIKLLREDK